jgi:nucleoside-diphosphate-sugar epimerase
MNELSSNQNTIKLTVIGGGYTGSAIAKHFYQQPQFRVQVTTTREERIPELQDIAHKVVIAKGEDPLSLQRLLEFQDVIISCVAPISDRQVDAATYRDTYIPLTQNLHKALKFHPQPQHLIYLSSSSVYGNQQGQWVDETSTVDLENEYNQVLNGAEQNLLLTQQDNNKITILRLGGIYGEGYELISRFKKLAGKTMPGRGNTYTAWIHLEDIIQAIQFIIENQVTGIINLVNDFDLTIQELSDKICAIGELEYILWDDTKPSYRALNARISNQKIKQLGYQLCHPQTII